MRFRLLSSKPNKPLAHFVPTPQVYAQLQYAQLHSRCGLFAFSKAARTPPPCILVLVVKCGRCGRDRPTPPWSTKRPSESLGRRAHCLPEEPEQLPGPSSTKSPHLQGWAIRKERTHLEYYSLCGSGCLQRTPGCCP